MRDGDGGLVLVRRIGQAPAGTGRGLLELARRQPLQVGGFAGSRRGCVCVGAMEEREQRRRCRGPNEAGERGLLQEAADGIPRALAMTDGRVVQGAAEAWRGFLPLEHRWVKLSLGRGRDSLSSAVKISTNDLWLRGLRHKPEIRLEFSTTKAWIG